MSRAMAAVAATGSAAVVSATTTDARRSTKQGSAQLPHPFEQEGQELTERRLERSLQGLGGKTTANANQSRAKLEATWRPQTNDLLEQQLTAEANWRVAATTFGSTVSASGQRWISIASDNSLSALSGEMATNTQIRAQALESGQMYQAGQKQNVNER